MKKVLVTGANGQLGKSILSIANIFPSINFIYKNSSELDITKKEDLEEEFLIESYDWCINCAAYTAVDKAEIEKEKAYLTNVIGVKQLAEICSDFSVKLIHVSTDFVFDGTNNKPYLETNKPNPKSVYGITKLEGEKEILKVLNEVIIIRTSWLYSEFGNNFMKTMLNLAESRKEIGVVNDQIGTPTYAKDLAKIIIKFICHDKPVYGLYHYSNEGAISWYDFAKAIFELNEISVKINPINTQAYSTAAIRPKYSVLDKTKVAKTLSVEIPYWKYSLIEALRSL